jgi:acetylornithine deacetylase/succinyl-diaminopimelate desuccinylase-like protein
MYSMLPILLITILLMSGCRPVRSVELPPFDGERAFEEVRMLVAYSPRDAGTPGGRKAAEHIHRRLEDFGIVAETDVFTDMTPAGEKTFRNITGRVPGKRDRWIILGSHFDTMPGIPRFQGANDSGSSTGVLLELARMIQSHGLEPEVGILFAFFDGEEGIAHYIPGDGLHGSRHLAAKLVESGDRSRIEAMVLLDMIGDKNQHFTIPANSSDELVKAVIDAAHAAGYRDRFSLDYTRFITDDHVPFLDIGIPAIDLIDFEYGSAPGLNDYWHTPDDHLENISTHSLQAAGEIMLELLKKMAFQRINQ